MPHTGMGASRLDAVGAVWRAGGGLAAGRGACCHAAAACVRARRRVQVAQDVKSAADYFEAAAEAGSVKAMNALASMLMVRCPVGAARRGGLLSAAVWCRY